MTKKKKAERVQMPTHLPHDHPHVTALLNESERLSGIAMRWANAKVPNQKAYQLCVENGWAMNVAAAHLRCRLKGELLDPPRSKFSILVEHPEHRHWGVSWFHIQSQQCHKVAHHLLNADGVLIEVPGNIKEIRKEKL